MAEISIKLLAMADNEPDYIPFDPEDPDPEKDICKTNFSSYADDSDGEQYIDQCSFGFSDCSKMQTKKLGKYDPTREYLVVVPGLSLKGKCQNPQCIANGKRTWIRLGYGTFDIGKAKHKSFCPCCKQKVNAKTILTLGYRNAEIVMEGAKLKGDQAEEFTYKDEERNGQLRYFADFDQNVTQWEYLEVTTKKIQK